MPLHLTSARYSEQSGDGDFAFGAAASETDFAPLHGAPKRAFRRVIGGLNALLTGKREESFETGQQRIGRITHILVVAAGVAIGKVEELLFQRNGFQNQLLPVNRAVSCARPVAEAMP